MFLLLTLSLQLFTTNNFEFINLLLPNLKLMIKLFIIWGIVENNSELYDFNELAELIPNTLTMII